MSKGNATIISPRESKLGQKSLDVLLDSGSSRLSRAFFHRLRRVLIKKEDPAISCQFEGRNLLFPLSHDLPLIRKNFPLYSSNVGRLAQAIEGKYAGAAIIDVGANVGDTVAIIRARSASPILCIEGNPFFLTYLRANCEGVADVELAEVLLSDKAERVRATLSTALGSAAVSHSDNDQVIQFETIDNVLLAHPRFANHKLLKIDTDGYDLRIIRSAAGVIAQTKPVLFFEYDPYFVSKIGEESFPIFQTLEGMGYNRLLIYENNGDFLLGTTVNDGEVLRDLHEFYSGREGKRYCDICAFHAEDDDLASSFHESELQFFRAQRALK